MSERFSAKTGSRQRIAKGRVENEKAGLTITIYTLKFTTTFTKIELGSDKVRLIKPSTQNKI